jgi:hypothetical protein
VKEVEIGPVGELDVLGARAAEYVAAAKAANTLRAYRSDWREFSAWAAWRQLEPLPATPQTMVFYLTDLADAANLEHSSVDAHREDCRRAAGRQRLGGGQRPIPLRRLGARGPHQGLLVVRKATEGACMPVQLQPDGCRGHPEAYG